MKVKIVKTSGNKGYDVVIVNNDAVVQDYLDAINTFIEENTQEPCRGCDECCWERIPLTSIDVLNYMNKSAVKLELELNWPLLDFIKRYCYVYVEGRVVDISLAYTLEGACAFLNQNQKICTDYTARSLVCQSFVCLESSERAAELRSQLVNTGMDELVRLWLAQNKLAGKKPYVHEAHKPEIRPEDYQDNAFSNKVSYRDILLRDVCSKELWKEIYISGK